MSPGDECTCGNIGHNIILMFVKLSMVYNSTKFLGCTYQGQSCDRVASGQTMFGPAGVKPCFG